MLFIVLLCFNLFGQVVEINPSFHFFVQCCLEFIAPCSELLQFTEIASGGIDFFIDTGNLIFERGDVIVDCFEFPLFFEREFQFLLLFPASVLRNFRRFCFCGFFLV